MSLKETIIRELEILKKELTKKDCPVAIQIPEGLKQFSTLILKELEGLSPALFVDPCFGACDLKATEAKTLGYKTLLHFGHKELPSLKKTKIKTIYVPLDYQLDKEQIDFIITEIKKLNYKKVNIVTTAQYLSTISLIKEELKTNGIETIESKETKRLQKHQILGCDCSNIIDKINPIIFIGDGYFHVNNISYIHKKQEIYIINPLSKTSEKKIYDELLLRQRYAAIAKAIECKSFGILVSTKIGQNRLKLALKIKQKLDGIGKTTYILISDYINENYLLGIDVDCYVNTACPRLVYDDFRNFKKPIISATEIEQILDIKKEIKIDQIN